MHRHSLRIFNFLLNGFTEKSSAKISRADVIGSFFQNESYIPTKSGVPKEDLTSSSESRLLASPKSTSLMSFECILTHRIFSG